MRKSLVVLGVLFLFGLSQPVIVKAQRVKSTATVTIPETESRTKETSTSQKAKAGVSHKLPIKENVPIKSKKLPETGEDRVNNRIGVSIVFSILLLSFLSRRRRGRH